MKVSFNKNIEFDKQGVCVGEDDFNYTIKKYQLMNDFVPWQGAHEKHPTLIQVFIETLCKHGVVVIDVTASTDELTTSSSTFM